MEHGNVGDKIFDLNSISREMLELVEAFYDKMKETTNANALYLYALQIFKICNIHNELPRLVVFGQQSMGKTTLLDFIMGGPMGYTSSDTGTKQPIVIILKPSETNKIECYLNKKKVNIDDLHEKMKAIMLNLSESIISKELEVEISIPGGIYATFVDLPGIKDDSKAGSELTRKIVRNYVQNFPNDIYILVKKASDDPANWPYHLKEFFMKPKPLGLGLQNKQCIVVGTRALEFLNNELSTIKTLTELHDRVKKRGITDNNDNMLSLYLLELFSIPIEQKEKNDFLTNRIAMYSKILNGRKNVLDLLLNKFENDCSDSIKKELIDCFDVEKFKQEVNSKFMNILIQQLRKVEVKIEKKKAKMEIYIKKLEELYNKGNILSIREQVKLYIRELVNIISNLLTGNYPILNLPKNGGDFLKKYGGTLMENLKDGNDLAIELYEKQGLYDENFLTYLNEYLIKKSNENEYNKSVISDFNNGNDLLNNLNSSIDDIKIGNNITPNTVNTNSMIGGINNGNNIGNRANASNNISNNSPNINNINNLNSSTNSNTNFSNSGGNNSMGTTNNNIINNSGIGKNNNSSSSNNNSNINSLNKRPDMYDSFNDRDTKRTNDKLLKVGQTVRFLLAKEESSMFGIVQNISNDARSKNILVNFFFRSNNIEEQIQVKSVEKERLIVIKPVETLNSDLFFLNGLQVWYKMTRDDGWVGFDKAEIIKVFNNNSKIKDVLIRNLSKNNEVVSIKINDLYADYTDNMDEEDDPMEEIYDEDDALKRIAGPHTDLKILNQLAITYICKWLKYNIAKIEPEKIFSDDVLLQMMRSIHNIVDQSDWKPLVVDLLQANISGNILYLTKLASCSAAVALNRVFKAGLGEINRKIKNNYLDENIYLLSTNPKFLEELSQALHNFCKERAVICANEMKEIVFEQTYAVHFEIIEEIFEGCKLFEDNFLTPTGVKPIMSIINKNVKQNLAYRNHQLSLSDVKINKKSRSKELMQEEVKLQFWAIKMLISVPFATKIYAHFLNNIVPKNKHLANVFDYSIDCESNLEKYIQSKLLNREVNGIQVPIDDKELLSHYNIIDNRDNILRKLENQKRLIQYLTIVSNSIKLLKNNLSNESTLDFVTKLDFGQENKKNWHRLDSYED
ncbi:conserved Plasmodium protein, unknown function [Plasmodium vinckei vinckei]|uniref:Dynamin N-terminal domain-containing protein n=1 Tax=Plasmodium vinckei vinckei TaxID=54757 RepID=A0A449C0J2_PLAVN|nr:conserved Plasmodium protein, unknown function [Plasmodium vinckei vinckei]VEV59119.1 conserved Plasmodium protein, unknown function [Plasmodium vinckei vinckei]